jgi:hypothetical protein
LIEVELGFVAGLEGGVEFFVIIRFIDVELVRRNANNWAYE